MYLWMLAAVVAYFIKGLCGFANTLVFTAILSFGSVNANISPIDLLFLPGKTEKIWIRKCISRWQSWYWQAVFPEHFC